MYIIFSCFDPDKSVSVTLSLLDKPGVKLSCLLRNMKSITRSQLQLLRNVDNLDRRLELAAAGHLDVQLGDQVKYIL